MYKFISLCITALSFSIFIPQYGAVNAEDPPNSNNLPSQQNIDVEQNGIGGIQGNTATSDFTEFPKMTNSLGLPFSLPPILQKIFSPTIENAAQQKSENSLFDPSAQLLHSSPYIFTPTRSLQVPNFFSPSVFLSPRASTLIFDLVCQLSPENNIREQIRLLQQFLSNKPPQQPMSSYIEGLLFVLQNQDILKSFNDSVILLQRDMSLLNEMNQNNMSQNQRPRSFSPASSQFHFNFPDLLRQPMAVFRGSGPVSNPTVEQSQSSNQVGKHQGA